MTTKRLTGTSRVRLCGGCEKHLVAASNAMRVHRKDLQAAISDVKTGLTSEQVDEHKRELIGSFFAAQSMWEAYRDHLKEHGILPVIPPPTQV